MTVHDSAWEELRSHIDDIVEDARTRKITTGEAARRILDIQRQMQELTYHLGLSSQAQSDAIDRRVQNH